MSVPGLRLEFHGDTLKLALWADLRVMQFEGLDDLQRAWALIKSELSVRLYFAFGLSVAMLAAASGDPDAPFLDPTALARYIDSFYLPAPDTQTSSEYDRGIRVGLERLGRLRGRADLLGEFQALIAEVNQSAQDAA